jgi:hypothetical protein
MTELDNINKKTLVRYRNKTGQVYFPAYIKATKGQGKNLQYELEWTNFNFAKGKHLTKWVKAKDCEQVVPELNRIQKLLYKLIDYFNT